METLLRVMWQPGWERSLGQNGYIYVCPLYTCNRASPEAQLVKNLPASAGGVRDEGSIPGLGRSPGEENGNLLQYSYLESSMDLEEPGGLQSMGLQRVRHLKLSLTLIISYSPTLKKKSQNQKGRIQYIKKLPAILL